MPVNDTPIQEAVSPTWPWTTQTTTQGFLSGRWLRRDGTVYGGAAARGLPGPNSAIAGGEDINARVDPSSGAPNAPPVDPARNLRPSRRG